MKVKSKKAKGKNFSVPLCLCGVILFFTASTFGQWVKQTVDTTASLRGLSVVNEKVVWASGTGGRLSKPLTAEDVESDDRSGCGKTRFS